MAAKSTTKAPTEPEKKYTEDEMKRALDNAERAIRNVMLIQQIMTQVSTDIGALRDDMNSVAAYDVPPVRKIGWSEECERIIRYLEDPAPSDADQTLTMQ